MTPFDSLRLRGSAYFSLVFMDSDKPACLRDFLQWLFGQAQDAPPPASLT